MSENTRAAIDWLTGIMSQRPAPKVSVLIKHGEPLITGGVVGVTEEGVVYRYSMKLPIPLTHGERE